MKSIFKAVLLVAAASLTLTVFAGEKPGRGHVNSHGTGHTNGNGHSNRHGNGRERLLDYNREIIGQNGSQGGAYLSAVQYCTENPDGTGGVKLSGYFEVRGSLAGYEVLGQGEYTYYDACPDTVNSEGDGSTQTITIIAGEYQVVAVCIGQQRDRFSGSGQTKYPGQKKPERYSTYSETYLTPNGSDGSCEITATDSEGNMETFGGLGLVDSDSYAIGYVSSFYRYSN